MEQYKEQLADFKGELADIRRDVLSLSVDESAELQATIASVDKEIFDASLSIKKLLLSPASFAASSSESNTNCILCKTENHPLYVCPRFKAVPRDEMISFLKTNELCMNCLRPGHYSKLCTSLNKCRKCQSPYLTLIHYEVKDSPPTLPEKPSLLSTVESTISSNTSTGSGLPNTLLMTCQVRINTPDGSFVKARALLDSASTTSFVSES